MGWGKLSTGGNGGPAGAGGGAARGDSFPGEALVRIAVLDHDKTLKAFENRGTKVKLAKEIRGKLSDQYPLSSIKTTMRTVFRDLRKEKGA